MCQLQYAFPMTWSVFADIFPFPSLHVFFFNRSHPNWITVIAQIFVRNLIWRKVRNLVAYENYTRIQVYLTPPSLYESLSYESRPMLEYETFPLTKISATKVAGRHAIYRVCLLSENFFCTRRFGLKIRAAFGMHPSFLGRPIYTFTYARRYVYLDDA